MKFSILFPVHNPSKKAHPQHGIQVFLDAERHEFWETALIGSGAVTHQEIYACLNGFFCYTVLYG